MTGDDFKKCVYMLTMRKKEMCVHVDNEEERIYVHVDNEEERIVCTC